MFPKRLSITCPSCSGPLDVKLRQRDRNAFVACHNFPHCDWACDLADLAVELSRKLASLGVTTVPLDLSSKVRSAAKSAVVASVQSAPPAVTELPGQAPFTTSSAAPARSPAPRSRRST